MTTDFGRVGVLYGGLSAEREVSLISGQGVCEALCDAGVDAHLFDTGRQDLAELAAAGFERVFIALHGRFGEDGTIQGVLELLGIPYTGSGVLASSLTMDKIATKRLWLQHGLSTPDFAVYRQADDLPAVQALGLPLIVKPPHEGSSLGLTRVESLDQLDAALALACRHDDRALVEPLIRGRELTVSVLGTGKQARALPVIEIIAPEGNFDFEHKYVSDETCYICPADLPAALTQQIQELSVRAYQVLGCEGWGRADLMLDAENRPWLLEMNTSPGMTSHSLVPMAAKALDMSYGELCVAILATARCKVHRVAGQ
ncbi:D-alanine--D-alanine ligase [Castellaniella sp.]|uniref:D-alanine--D-alanine ligase n=1 Tax=Castellaniella sp. TaxID=1955812 RepID=UPI002AFE9566|nr:D-alanine--D-alanine ligase [Castellaniella sp.]